MLARAVQSYLSVRRAAGFRLRDVELHFRSFAAYSNAKGQRYVNSQSNRVGAAGAFGGFTSSTAG